MNVKALDQLEEIRSEGQFNMWTEANHIVAYANEQDMFDLVLYSQEKSWVDILSELSEYKEILNDFEAQGVDDE
jgi:hypothetical protein